jgi:hypothetical protein
MRSVRSHSYGLDGGVYLHQPWQDNQISQRTAATIHENGLGLCQIGHQAQAYSRIAWQRIPVWQPHGFTCSV